jgi:hypothetical protein
VFYPYSLSTALLSLLYYLTVQTQFVQVVRAVEIVLGIPVPGLKPGSFASSNFTAALGLAGTSTIFTQEVRSVLLETVPILLQLGLELKLDAMFHFSPNSKLEPLITK